MRIRLFFILAMVPVLAGLIGNTRSQAHAESVANQLSVSEAASNWELLFDGSNLDQWRNYKSDSVSNGWKIVDGALTRVGNGAGDLITKEQFEFFELSLEYKISEGGNSGLMFRVTEEEKTPWMTGPEVQIQDNVKGHDPQKAGWLYQLYQPKARKYGLKQAPPDACRPAGQWNHLYLRISPNGCEVCVNGVRYYNFSIGDNDWNERVAKSKFAQFKNFGKASKGHVCLQDHGNEVAFRSIKVRKIVKDQPAPQPITGKLNLSFADAFPNLKWDQWEPTDDDGKSQPLRLMELTYPRDGSKRLFAASQRGEVWTFENRPDVQESKLFLDLRDKVVDFRSGGANEQGLLGFALHPDFKSNGYVYTYYSEVKTNRSIISRWSVSKDDPNVGDVSSEKILMTIDQPFQNHNGGSIEFGPDGFLYIGMGDGGDANDPFGNGQKLDTLLGKILRIDVNQSSGEKAYGIPADNPFVNRDGVSPEIYAYGLRNPWRIAFDPDNGRLWSGEVGQDLLEEVLVIEKGGNYGWSAREGTQAFGNQDPNQTAALVDPVWEYDHQVGKSVTGGRVYRGKQLPVLSGKYVYADYVTGSVWALTYDENTKKATANEQVVPDSIPVLAFGQDEAGEIYFLTNSPSGQSIQKFVMPASKQ
jgi:glucose/arabinose dehydrogenase